MVEWYTDDEMEELDESIGLYDWYCSECCRTFWTTVPEMPDGWKQLWDSSGQADLCEECAGRLGYD